MSVYSHFDMRGGPFDDAALSETFYAAPAHDECMATLCYVERTGKTCMAIVGETGVGKTYLVRLFLGTLSPERTVLYVRAGDDDVSETQATEYTVRDLVNDEPAVVREGPLRSMLHTADRSQGRPLVIVDHAEELNERNRRDLMAVCDAPVHSSATVIMMANPVFYAQLTQTCWLRLRRRIFRICSLPVFSIDQVKEYISERLSAVGGSMQDLFEEEAISQIARATKGNPALINHLCENALIEAWSEERKCVNARDVREAKQAILGDSNLAAMGDPAYAQAKQQQASLPAPIETEPELISSDPVDLDSPQKQVVEANTSAANSDFSRRMRQLQRRLHDTLTAIRTGSAKPESEEVSSTADNS